MRKFRILLLALFVSTVALCSEVFQGKASYYGNEFEGRTTANGEIYTHNKFTCAHRTLPFGTKLKVTNLSNNKVVYVTVNDRGPFHASRIIDVSKSAAQQLGFVNAGTATVSVEIVE